MDRVNFSEEDIDQVDDLEAMKGMMKKVLKIVEAQQKRISELEDSQQLAEDRIIKNANDIYEVSERLVEVEKYSRKLCLIFHNLDYSFYADPTAFILSFFAKVLQVNLSPNRIAACHPLSQSPNPGIIVKFLYHADRDIVWNRKSWLNGHRNRYGYSYRIEECLAPRDRFLKQEARNMGIKTFTRKQDLFAFNDNMPNSRAVKITQSQELSAFVIKERPEPTNQNIPQPPVTESGQTAVTKEPMEVLNTPLPNLTRKPETPAFSSNPARKRQRFQLSPVNEPDSGQENLVADLAKLLIPALIKEMTSAANEGGLEPFRSEAASTL